MWPRADIDSDSLDAVLDRVADARLVLLGEASHGTSEFYRMRGRITRELIAHRGFPFVAVEADWPDASRIDDYVLGGERRSTLEFTPFDRFPTWSGATRRSTISSTGFARTTRTTSRRSASTASISTASSRRSPPCSPTSTRSTLLPQRWRGIGTARSRRGRRIPRRTGKPCSLAVTRARSRPWSPCCASSSNDASTARKDGDRFFDAAQNARVVANAERYYRSMYYGSAASWNLRDAHMFSTLESLLAFHGPNSKGIVWAHNSHVGNAQATEMSVRKEHNIGQLARTKYGNGAYIIGFGTDHGTVAAASNWDEPMQRMTVRPSHPDSYERVCHESGVPAFMLHLREPKRRALRDELEQPRLERAIGVIYRPETELASHYFYATLPHQFDEYVWLDETRAVQPLDVTVRPSLELPDTYPFGV